MCVYKALSIFSQALNEYVKSLSAGNRRVGNLGLSLKLAQLLLLFSCSVVSVCFATVGTAARQAPVSMGFPGKNAGVGCHFLLQGIFPTQGWNLSLLHWPVDTVPLSHLGSPRLAEYCIYTGVLSTSEHMMMIHL